jgi:hypothetical protein
METGGVGNGGPYRSNCDAAPLVRLGELPRVKWLSSHLGGAFALRRLVLITASVGCAVANTE